MVEEKVKFMTIGESFDIESLRVVVVNVHDINLPNTKIKMFPRERILSIHDEENSFSKLILVGKLK